MTTRLGSRTVRVRHLTLRPRARGSRPWNALVFPWSGDHYEGPNRPTLSAPWVVEADHAAGEGRATGAEQISDEVRHSPRFTRRVDLERHGADRDVALTD